MHGSVRNELENLLAAHKSDSRASHCRECAAELEAMRIQSQMLKTFRPPDDIEPAAGFYARVMQRIEETAKRSIWWVFVYSPIGKRLAYASLALSLALGSYVVAAESNDGHLNGSQAARRAHNHYDVVVSGNAEQQRAAVLGNFFSHPASNRQTATLE